MKAVFIISLMALYSSCLLAQNSKVVKVNTLEADNINTIGYAYPEFVKGKVFFHNQSPSDALLNFNRLTSEVLFIAPKGDTLALANPENTTRVVIGIDTFCFFEKSFLRKVTHYEEAPDLFLRENIKYLGNEKKGAYGTYSSVSAVNSYTSVSSSPGSSKNSGLTKGNDVTGYIPIDENLVYKGSVDFFIRDADNNFFPAKKSTLFKLFPQFESQLKTFIGNNKINFNNKEHLIKVISYLQTLQKAAGTN